MQLQLSNLVDLALGKPHYLNCDQFNLLHTFLHVLLIKLKLEDVNVELEGDFAARVEKLHEFMPKDTLLNVKEFQVSPGGSRLRRRKPKQIAPRRSLMQISRKWINCCPAQDGSRHSISPSENSSSSSSMNFIDIVSDEDEKRILNEKISALQAELTEVKKFLDEQILSNLKAKCALEEFHEMKAKFEELVPNIEKILEEQKNRPIIATESNSTNKNDEGPISNLEKEKTATEQDSLISLIDCDNESEDSFPPSPTLSPTPSSTEPSCDNDDDDDNDEVSSEPIHPPCCRKKVTFDPSKHFSCENFQFDDNETIFSAEGDRPQCKTEMDPQNISCWINKLSHQLETKPDRSEFEMMKLQVFNLIKAVSKIRQFHKGTSGGIGPFMMVTNRAVSRGTAHHFNQSKCTMPRFAELKNGSQCVMNSRNIRRAVGGSHTRINRSNQVKDSRYARLATPLKICSSLLVCKSRFGTRNF